MGQQEVINFIRNNPRVSTREIANGLNLSIHRVSVSLKTLKKHNEVEEKDPTEEELKKLLKIHPSVSHGIYKLKVFIVNEK